MIDQEKEASEQSDAVRKEFEAQCNKQNLSGKTTRASSTNNFNTVSTPVNAASAPRTSNDGGPSFVPLGGSFLDNPLMPDLEDTVEVQNTGIFCSAYDDNGLDEEDASKQGRRKETVDAATTGVSTAVVTIRTAEPRTPPSSITVFDDEDVTMEMAQTLIKIKEQKAKEKGVAIIDAEDSSRTVRLVRSITTLQPLPIIDPKEKGKGVLVKEEHVKIKRRDQGDLQIQANAKLAQRLHEEELAELERRQKERVA
ncbi:hypothetical protein Tco_1085027 [Tanacetum coccineum]